MPKAKLKINASEVKKAKVASEFSGVIISPKFKKIGNEVHLSLSTPSTNNYIEFGRLLATVSGNELDEQEESPKKEAPPHKAV